MKTSESWIMGSLWSSMQIKEHRRLLIFIAEIYCINYFSFYFEFFNIKR